MYLSLKLNIKKYIIQSIAFLALFIYFYPIEFKAFPISLARIIQIVGFFLFCLHYSKNKIDRRLLYYYGYGICVFLMGFVATSLINDAYEYQIAFRGLYIFLFSFSAYFIVYTIKKSVNNFTFFTLLEWILYVSVLQSIISFIFFFFPNILDGYNNIVVVDEFNEEFFKTLNSYRLIGAGPIQYATAAVQYGIVLWGAILLYYCKYPALYNNKIFFTIILALISVAGILSGRTFLLILVITVLYVFFLNGKAFFLRSIKFFALLLILLVIVCFVLFNYLLDIDSEAFKWAFELFVNLNDGGSFESSSTNDLKSMYVFPDNTKTWLLGDGKLFDGPRGFYMNTDVGYLRNIFYWGILGTFIFYLIQYGYYRILRRTTNNLSIRKYLFLIIVWFYIYNLKDLWQVDQFFILFLIALLNQPISNSNLLNEK